MVMSASPSSSTRRSFLAASAAAGAFSIFPKQLAAEGDSPESQPANQGNLPLGTTEDNAIRPFRINFPEEALSDLRRRIAATRWPEKETVADQSQGSR
jgi:Epoxide hydrolase N terminus